jgi:hypothetical protein
MEIIEQYTRGKRNQETNEDTITVTSKFAAVIDGATNKSRTQVDTELSNGRYVAIIINDAISKIEKDISCAQFCTLVTKSIYQIYCNKNILDRMILHPEERLTASVIIYSEIRKQIWMIGDCQALIDGELYLNPKPADIYASNIRSNYINQELRSGADVSRFLSRDTGRDMVVPLIIDCCAFQNSKEYNALSFSVVDGFEINLAKVRMIDIAPSTKEIVLASDGYPKLLPTLAECESELKEQLKVDPLCINRFKSTKGLVNGNVSFDDRSYLRIKI